MDNILARGFDCRFADSFDAMTAEIDAAGCDAVLVDDYAMDDAAFRAAAKSVFRAQFDDVGVVRHADVIINPGLSAAAGSYAGTKARLLCGPQFAVIDEVFSRARDTAPTRGLEPRLLISMGGRDSRNLTALALTAARAAGIAAITVVLGRAAPHRDSIADQCRRMNCDLVIDATAKEMAALYAAHGMAVGAGGVSLLERLCCGVPSIVIGAAANQDSNLAAVEKLEIGRVLRANSDDIADRLRATIAEMAADAGARARFSRNGMNLIDGGGARRVAEFLAAA